MLERLPPPARILCEARPAPPSRAALRRVAAAWALARAEQPFLFDGELFSVHDQSGDTLRGHFVPYRFWVAQRRDPALFDELGVCALGVTGYLRVADHVILGRRGSEVAAEAGRWELAPTGGIERAALTDAGDIDPVRQLSLELEEELGIPGDALSDPSPLALVSDAETHLLAVVVGARLELTPAAVEALFAAVEAPEYAELALVPERDAGALLHERDRPLASLTRFVLEATGAVIAR